LRFTIMAFATQKATVRGAAVASRRSGRGARAQPRAQTTRAALSMDADEIELLETMLLKAKARKEQAANEPKPSSAGDYDGPAFTVKTFNAISPTGLKRFPAGKYDVSGEDHASPMAIMLRSHKLQEEEVPSSVRCIARCGAGTNNIPVARMTELGVPVFNTPGANANAVKELVICSLLLASRGIYEGIKHTEDKINVEEGGDYDKISKRIEADKKFFVGQEITGKTLGVVGLGQIGARVVEAALALGMKVVGYDPALSMEAALMLPGDRMVRAGSLEEVLKVSDYITLHVPYIKGVTHHLIDADALSKAKSGLNILNFARGEIVDGAAVKEAWSTGRLTGKYISDFADDALLNESKHIVMPHLGASTGEAEENSAAMAADTIKLFLETGAIRHSVNFPTTTPTAKGNARLCIVNKNVPGVLGNITTFLGTQDVNIVSQVNNSNGEIAYTIIDMETAPADPDALQSALAAQCDGIISSRFIGTAFDDNLGKPGTFFYVNWAQ